MKVANGRIPGDRLGNFTCYTNRGASVVDYIISDQSFFNRLKRLKILDPTFGSVHSTLSLVTDCSFSRTATPKKAPLPPPPKLIWDPTRIEHFKIMLSQKVNKLDAIKYKLCNPNCTIEETDQMIKELTDTLFDAASASFRLAKRHNNPLNLKENPGIPPILQKQKRGCLI